MESLAAGMGRARYALKMSQVETGESPGRELKKGDGCLWEPMESGS